MGEHKNKVEAYETKAIKPENEAEQLSGYHPADALRKIVGGPPSTIKPAQILALQRTVGNKVVQRVIDERKQQSGPDAQADISPSGDLIQRHPEDTAKIDSLTSATNDNMSLAFDRIARRKSEIDGLKEVTNDNMSLAFDRIARRKSETDELKEAANHNTTVFGDALMRHSDRLAQHGARISSLESSGGGSGGGGDEGEGGSEGGRSSRSRNRTSAPPP
jgi:uncharacterized membrane protein YgcG